VTQPSALTYPLEADVIEPTNNQGINLTHNRYSRGARTVCTFTVVAITSMAAHAATADISGPQQATVRFADLNLSAQQGAETLYARIQSAARQVCGPEDDKNLALFQSRRACVDKAIADAVAHVGNAQLRAVYEARQGQKQPTRTAAVAQR